MKKKLLLLIVTIGLVFSCYKMGRVYFLEFEKEYYNVYIGDYIKFNVIKIIPKGEYGSVYFKSYNEKIHSEVRYGSCAALKEGDAKIIAYIYDNGTEASAVLQIRDTIVMFKDQKFKNYLLSQYNRYDKNKDGEFHRSELIELYSLTIEGDSITCIDEVKYLQDLSSITLKDLKIKKFEIENLYRFETLSLYGGTIIDTINIKNCQKFKGISKYSSDNNIVKNIAITGDNKVEDLSVRNMGVEKLNISDCQRITSIYCDGNNIKTLDVSPFEKLTHLNCSNNFISFLNLSNNESLRYLYTKGNPKLSKICVKDKNAFYTISADFFTKVDECD